MGRSQDPAAQDKYENELIAAGAVFMALTTSAAPGIKAVRIVTDEQSNATTSIDIDLSFMNSPYRLTVTLAPEAPF